MIVYISMLIILISILLMVVSAVKAKNYFDRIMCLNCIGSFTTAIIVIIATFNNGESFIDIAMIYALLNFITTIAFLRYFKHLKEK